MTDCFLVDRAFRLFMCFQLVPSNGIDMLNAQDLSKRL